MDNDNLSNSKRKIIITFKHITAVAIISTALISSLNNAVHAAVSTPTIHNLYRSYIYLAYKDRATNLLASSSEKRKDYKSEDRFEILSALTGESADSIKIRIQNDETVEDIAKEYGVLYEFNSCVLKAYNYGLDKLYKAGKLSEEEYNSMYNNADLSFINTCDTKSRQNLKSQNCGNITKLLSSIIEKDENEVEKLLVSGQNPWIIAEKYDKYSELKDLVFENTLSNIDQMLESGEITSSEADDIIADFESSFLSKVN